VLLPRLVGVRPEDHGAAPTGQVRERCGAGKRSGTADRGDGGEAEGVQGVAGGLSLDQKERSGAVIGRQVLRAIEGSLRDFQAS